MLTLYKAQVFISKQSWLFVEICDCYQILDYERSPDSNNVNCHTHTSFGDRMNIIKFATRSAEETCKNHSCCYDEKLRVVERLLIIDGYIDVTKDLG